MDMKIRVTVFRDTGEPYDIMEFFPERRKDGKFNSNTQYAFHAMLNMLSENQNSKVEITKKWE